MPTLAKKGKKKVKTDLIEIYYHDSTVVSLNFVKPVK